MMKIPYSFSLILCCGVSMISLAQNETSKWFFGANAALDFISGSPVSIQSPTMMAPENASSIADANGNLLFYTNSETIWNASHNVMANGSGILGNWSTVQSIIVNQPGSNSIYHVFTIDDMGGPDGLRYSTVDMNLAAGMGSVTAKNIPLYNPCSEQITATRHCNGSDIWVLAHSNTGNGFRAYLVTAAGVNATPVISNIGTPYYPGSVYGACMKFSPNGHKLGMPLSIVTQQTISTTIELFDFDSSTGALSNPQNISLANTSTITNNGPYGSEFSPDGTKFYVSQILTSMIYQFDLCNNNQVTAIPSQFNGLNNYFGAMQLGPDGKIYVSRAGNINLGIINNPDLPGAACNYNDMGPAFTPAGLVQPTNQFGLPGFVSNYLKKLPSFSYTENCQTASFTPPAQACAAVSQSYTSMLWNFGDPSSGNSNTSTLQNPSHLYSSTGNYSVTLILYYPCSTDTIKTPVTIATIGPSLSLSGVFTICRGQSATITASGANSYSWSSGSTGPVTVLSPTFSSIYTITGSNANGDCPVTRSFTIGVSACTGIEPLTNLPDGGEPWVYPNPAKGVLNVDVKKNLQLIIYNQLGAVIYEKSLLPGKNTLTISELNNGVYVAKISDGAITKTIRFVKIE